MLRFAIDWIEITSKRNNGIETTMSDYLINFADNEVMPTTNHNGYTNALTNRAGAVVSWNIRRADMGIHVTYSGSTLNKYRSEGTQAEDMVKHYVDAGDKITRIDLAIDVVDTELSVKELYNKLKSGKAKTKGGRGFDLREKSDGGITLYVGSWNSPILLRIYDKGKEMHTNDIWVRVELRINQPKAESVGRMIAMRDPNEAVKSMRGMLNAIVSFPGKLWSGIAGDETIKITTSDPKGHDTRAWLLELVAPAMGKYISKTSDNAVVDAFFDIVEAYRKTSDEWRKDVTENVTKVDNAIET